MTYFLFIYENMIFLETELKDLEGIRKFLSIYTQNKALRHHIIYK